ncbi:MAG: hypothetical protein RLZZ373_1190, partial [Pseudomonadota bacterium]
LHLPCVQGERGMTTIVTDQQIKALRALPKKLMNPGARGKQQERMITHDYRVESLDGQHHFSVYKRKRVASAAALAIDES